MSYIALFSKENGQAQTKWGLESAIQDILDSDPEWVLDEEIFEED